MPVDCCSMTSSDSDCDGDDVVFLSPEEEIQNDQDQGASPVLLRRSNRKRKSVSAANNQGMSKGSSSKKKKVTSPNQAKTMSRGQGLLTSSSRRHNRTRSGMETSRDCKEWRIC